MPAAADLLGAIPPPVFLALIVSAILALLFKGIAGRRSAPTWLCLVAAVAGFAMGQLVGENIVASSVRVGEVHIVEACIVSWLGLLLVNYQHV